MVTISFVAGAALEFLWAPMTVAITERRPLRAAVLGTAVAGIGMVAASAVAQRSVPDEVAYLVGTFLGLFVGTKWTPFES